MPPDQQQDQNPYDFILNTGQTPKRVLGGGLGKGRRILIVAILGMALLTVIIMVFSLLASGGKQNQQTLLSIVQQQEELMRVSDIGAEKARSTAAQNLAVTTKLSVASAQKDLMDYMAQQGLKVKPKQLTLAYNSNTDDELSAAEQNNRFDEKFTEIINKQLTAYQSSLRKAHSQATRKPGRDLLSRAFDNTKVLLDTPPGS